MLELVSFAERVPKVSKGSMWKETDVLRYSKNLSINNDINI